MSDSLHPSDLEPVEDQYPDTPDPSVDPNVEPDTRGPSRLLRVAGLSLFILGLLLLIGYFILRHTVRSTMANALPQLDGTITLPRSTGLQALVTVTRDAHGVPHISAASIDDLIFAQGYVTAQDRLWQMDMLRRHAAGELASILGSSLLEHDRLQRTLGLRAAADRALTVLPAGQKHSLEVYTAGVNTYLNTHRDRLPLEFRVLQYTPAAWSPRDSLLLALLIYQEESTEFPTKLGREALTAHLPANLIADLYPTGSWRDHYPGQPIPDLTTPQPSFGEIPLDNSQSRATPPRTPTLTADELASLQKTLAVFHPPCPDYIAGSNGWAVSGAHTASGKPLLSNDMHLSLSVPELWYEADLEARNSPPLAPFHVAGITLPGTPFVISGHNDHVAWGFTNLGGDLQDLYIEHTRGTLSGAEYQAADGSWRRVSYRREIIHVRGSSDVTLDVPIVQHGTAETPLISSIFPRETRSISLRWTLYDPANIGDPFQAVDSATDWSSILSAFANFGGPTLNMMYADDQGHIGYHVVGRIPIRGSAVFPSPLSAVPTETGTPDAATHEWAGYIPFDKLPQSFDPPDGILATANGRITPDNYAFPITLDWMAPYRTERIYKLLESTPGKPSEPRHNLSPADMLAVQTDVHSELDLIYAQRLAYAIDHTTGPLKKDAALRQASDILRRWNGEVLPNQPAPAIINAARNVLWPLLLVPKLAPQLAPAMLKGTAIPSNTPRGIAQDAALWHSYEWGEKPFVEEQILTHQPAQWLPPGYSSWEDFLAAVVHIGLREANAPRDLAHWSEGKAYPLILDHPIFSRSPWLQQIIGQPTGPGTVPQRGDMTTIVQVGAAFGPSERLTVDLSNPDATTLNLVLGESGNVSSPYYLDHFPAWLNGTTFPLPFTPAAITPTHTLTLTPQ